MAKRKIDNPPLLIRPEFSRLFSKLTNADIGYLMRSLMSYRFDGVIPSLPEKLYGIFMALCAFADEDADKYKDKCEGNRKNAIDRWEKEKNKSIGTDATECE